MKTRCFFAVVGLIASLLTAGAVPCAEDAAVRYAKTLPVSKLDKHLPSERLETWLRSGPPHLDDVTWEVDENCGIEPENREPPLDKRPLCVKFVFERSGPGDPVDGSGIIQVGTRGQGIIGAAQFLGL